MKSRQPYLEANKPSAGWSVGFAKALVVALLVGAGFSAVAVVVWMVGQDGGLDPSHVPDGFGRGLALRMWSLGLSLTLALVVWRDIKRIKALDRMTASGGQLPCIDCGQVLALDAGSAGACTGCGAEVDARATRQEWAKVRARAKLAEMAD